MYVQTAKINTTPLHTIPRARSLLDKPDHMLPQPWLPHAARKGFANLQARNANDLCHMQLSMSAMLAGCSKRQLIAVLCQVTVSAKSQMIEQQGWPSQGNLQNPADQLAHAAPHAKRGGCTANNSNHSTVTEHDSVLPSKKCFNF
jgi:hypothetical protein